MTAHVHDEGCYDFFSDLPNCGWRAKVEDQPPPVPNGRSAMIRVGRFFTVNRLGRWLNRHGHRFLHQGKTGRYAMRVADPRLNRSCFICRAVWAFCESVMPSLRMDEQ